MNIEAKHQTAADRLTKLVLDKVGAGEPVHPGTAICSAALLAGSLLFKTFPFNPAQIARIAPGTLLLSDFANIKGPTLMHLAGHVLQSAGMAPDMGKLDKFPATGADSKLSIQQVQVEMMADALEIVQSGGLNLEEGAWAAALATGSLVKASAAQIGVEKGFNIAIYGFVEGCKTVPFPMVRKSGDATKQPWYKRKLW